MQLHEFIKIYYNELDSKTINSLLRWKSRVVKKISFKTQDGETIEKYIDNNQPEEYTENDYYKNIVYLDLTVLFDPKEYETEPIDVAYFYQKLMGNSKLHVHEVVFEEEEGFGLRIILDKTFNSASEAKEHIKEIVKTEIETVVNFHRRRN